jgi:hypothetical protein
MNRSTATRRGSFGILIVAMLACQFILYGRAEAATAHCLGNIQDTGGHIIVDLGTVAAYTALFPQNQNHQGQCVADVSAAASSWLSNSGQMCHTFLAANGSNLIFFYKLGSLSWRDSGTATSASSYNYPHSCFGLSGTAFPSYYIFTLIYTPPGCTPSSSSTGYKCGSGSFVSYGSGSSAGSTVSIENSTGSSTSVTATLGAANDGLSAGASYSETAASGSSVTISKATNTVVTWPSPGPAGSDGINHDYDQFFILLNPAVAITGWHDPVTQQNHAQWSLGTKNGAPAKIQRVQVSYLRCALAGIGPRPGNSGNGGGPAIYDPTGLCSSNPFLQMQGPADASASNGWLPGLTYDDYKQILAQDLFWNASPSNPVLIPTSRFAQQTTDFTYDQAGGPQGASCAVQSHSISNSNTVTNTSSTQYQASMSLSVGFPLGTTGIDLKSATSFTWTNKTSNSLTNANSQTATATVGCTSINWAGPDFVSTYYDTIYGTFLFALDDGTGYARLLQGTITDADGDLVPHIPLMLVVGNKSYQSFSRNNGSFLFHLPTGQVSSGTTTGTLTVGSTGGITKSVSVGPQATATAAIPTPAPSLSVALTHAAPPPNPVPIPTPNTGRIGIPATSLLIAVTNQSLFAVAKNVTITSIQANTSTGSPLAYSGSLPVTLPGGTALMAGRTASLPLTFTNAAASPAFLAVTVKADNLPPFSTVLLQSPVLTTTPSPKE